MATRKRRVRRRRAAVVTRRRRRRHVVAASAAPRRRRRVHHRVRHTITSNPRRRRRARRNPPSVRGVTGSIVSDLKNGGAVFVGGVATRKIRGAITGMLPAATQTQVAGAAGQVGLSIVGAVVTAMAARKFAGSYAKFVAAGAFAEAIACGVAQTPIAPFLAAFPVRASAPRVAAYPAVRAVGVRAYPTTALPVRSGMNAYPTMRSVGATQF